MNERIRARAKERVQSVLDGMWNGLGPLDRDELVAMMDGAQEGWQEWMPPVKGRKRA